MAARAYSPPATDASHCPPPAPLPSASEAPASHPTDTPLRRSSPPGRRTGSSRRSLRTSRCAFPAPPPLAPLPSLPLLCFSPPYPQPPPPGPRRPPPADAGRAAPRRAQVVAVPGQELPKLVFPFGEVRRLTAAAEAPPPIPPTHDSPDRAGAAACRHEWTSPLNYAWLRLFCQGMSEDQLQVVRPAGGK